MQRKCCFARPDPNILGGTASVLGGGKFENGAMTGAFSRLFNDEAALHKWRGINPPLLMAQAQSNLATQLSQAIDKIGDFLGVIFKSDSVILARNMIQAGDYREQGEHAHHIVAVNDVRAEPARQVLDSVKMDINSPYNGVFLDGSYHQGIHTTNTIIRLIAHYLAQLITQR